MTSESKCETYRMIEASVLWRCEDARSERNCARTRDRIIDENGDGRKDACVKRERESERKKERKKERKG